MKLNSQPIRVRAATSRSTAPAPRPREVQKPAKSNVPLVCPTPAPAPRSHSFEVSEPQHLRGDPAARPSQASPKGDYKGSRNTSLSDGSSNLYRALRDAFPPHKALKSYKQDPIPFCDVSAPVAPRSYSLIPAEAATKHTLPAPESTAHANLDEQKSTRLEPETPEGTSASGEAFKPDGPPIIRPS